MPIFEFQCDKCGKQFSALVGVVANAKPPACPKCGSTALSKLVSRFARLRSEDEKLDSLADESAIGDIENDPKAMRRWVRDMGKAMDDDMDDDLEEAMEEELSGKSGSGGTDAPDDTVY